MTKINLDRMFYLVIRDHRSGAFVPEQDVADLDRASVIKSIAEAQHDDVLAVIEFNPVERTSRIVTEDIALTVIEQWEQRDEAFADWQVDFVEAHFGVSAANRYRKHEYA